MTYAIVGSSGSGLCGLLLGWHCEAERKCVCRVWYTDWCRSAEVESVVIKREDQGQPEPKILEICGVGAIAAVTVRSGEEQSR